MPRIEFGPIDNSEFDLFLESQSGELVLEHQPTSNQWRFTSDTLEVANIGNGGSTLTLTDNVDLDQNNLSNASAIEVLSQLDIPVYSDDTNAPNESVYYDSTDGALEYKDSNGTIISASGEVSNPLEENLDAGGFDISNVGALSTDEQPNANTHYVGTDRDLQTVIDNSNPYDRLVVERGHSYSTGITIDKPLHVEFMTWGDWGDGNIEFSGLGSSEDAVTINADSVIWDKGCVHITDGSGRDAYHVPSGSGVRLLYTPFARFENPGRKGFHIGEGVHHRFGNVWGNKANGRGYHTVAGSLNCRMYGNIIYVSGCGGPDSVPAVDISNSNSSSVNQIVGAGGSSSFGGDAYQGIHFGAGVEYVHAGGLYAEDVTNEGVAFKTTTSGSPVSDCHIGTIKATQVGKDSSTGVLFSELTNSFVGRVKQTAGGSPAATGIDYVQCRGTVIGTSAAVDGTTFSGTGNNIPQIMDDQFMHLPDATASDLPHRVSCGFDTTNDRFVWKDAFGDAWYIDGTAL